jgi:hypothetical protein
MPNSPNFYLMIASDTEDLNGRRVDSLTMVLRRLSINVWPLYRQTPFKKKLKHGDKLLFYTAGRGKNRTSVIGSAYITEIVDNNYSCFWEQVDKALTPEPTQLVLLNTTQIYANPKSIIEIRKKISFIGDYPKWGVYMQGGVKRLTVDDVALLGDS